MVAFMNMSIPSGTNTRVISSKAFFWSFQSCKLIKTLSSQPLFTTGEKFPLCKYVFENSLSLPMYHELGYEDIDYLVKSIKLIYE